MILFCLQRKRIATIIIKELLEEAQSITTIATWGQEFNLITCTQPISKLTVWSPPLAWLALNDCFLSPDLPLCLIVALRMACQYPIGCLNVMHSQSVWQSSFLWADISYTYLPLHSLLCGLYKHVSLSPVPVWSLMIFNYLWAWA